MGVRAGSTSASGRLASRAMAEPTSPSPAGNSSPSSSTPPFTSGPATTRATRASPGSSSSRQHHRGQVDRHHLLRHADELVQHLGQLPGAVEPLDGLVEAIGLDPRLAHVAHEPLRVHGPQHLRAQRADQRLVLVGEGRRPVSRSATSTPRTCPPRRSTSGTASSASGRVPSR